MAHGVEAGVVPNGQAPGLLLQQVSVGFGGRDVLHGLDLSLAGGSLTAVLGRSGVGKSTLLRRIAGLVDGGGSVAADDSVELPSRVAFMGQSDLLLPWLTVAANAALGARLRGEKIDQARLDNVLSAVGLNGHEGKRPAELSGGMKQRAALARTLMEDRPVVLMDEPFSSVDALTRIRLQDLAARLLASRTVLLVTHDPWEAIRMADRIVVLSGDPAGLAFDRYPDGEAPRGPDNAVSQTLWRDLMAALQLDQAA
jgi:putative hydroxymethylpyrimidine transport system ATP-binding protein